MPELIAADPAPFLIAFAGFSPPTGAALTLSLPVLAGAGAEAVFAGATAAGRRGNFALYRAGDWLLGCASEEVRGDLEAVARRLYGEMFAAARGRHLCRVWNCVPAINDAGENGLENYRAFSRGRADAFEAEFGDAFKQRLPAASAVGCDDHRLALMFAAHVNEPRHFENPLQVPAYEYPAEHGPRAPSFARATVVSTGAHRVDAFISGTAAIRGHYTVSPDDTAGQIACTLENLREISRVCGLGDDLAADRAAARHFRVYLRQAADLQLTERSLSGALLRPADRVSYLRADICRAALSLEIEVAVMGAPAE